MRLGVAFICARASPGSNRPVIPQATEWQCVANEINSAMIFAGLRFVVSLFV